MGPCSRIGFPRWSCYPNSNPHINFAPYKVLENNRILLFSAHCTMCAKDHEHFCALERGLHSVNCTWHIANSQATQWMTQSSFPGYSILFCLISYATLITMVSDRLPREREAVWLTSAMCVRTANLRWRDQSLQRLLLISQENSLHTYNDASGVFLEMQLKGWGDPPKTWFEWDIPSSWGVGSSSFPPQYSSCE